MKDEKKNITEKLSASVNTLMKHLRHPGSPDFHSR